MESSGDGDPRKLAVRVHLATVLAVLIAAQAVAPQVSRNVELMDIFVPKNGIPIDVWGYTTPDGRDFALLGTTTGTYVIDCSDPRDVKEVGYFAAALSGWAHSPWRDVKTFGNHAYVVTEGGGGMQIIDLTTPTSPRLVQTWGKNVWAYSHNIAVDLETGIAYACGTRNGTQLIDLKTDPRNPKYVATFQALPVHDLHVYKGHAHCADINANQFFIVDVRNVPQLPVVSVTHAPGLTFAHSAWVTADDQYAVTTNEWAGGPVGVMDVRNKKAPIFVGRYTTGPPDAIPHNAYMKDRVCHISYYTEGYRSVDLSNPSAPLEVGYYDTWPESGGGFKGNWGCYCFNDSGIVYASDQSYGLFILRPKAAAERYGAGTPGAATRVPVIKPFGAAYLGNPSFRLEVHEGAPNQPAVLVLGVAPTQLSFGGLWVNVLPGPLIPASTDSVGTASVSLPVPNVKALDGMKLYAQFFVADSQGVLGYAASRGLAFELFER